MFGAHYEIRRSNPVQSATRYLSNPTGVGLADVAGGDGADVLDGDVVEADAGVEGEGGDDGGLGGGVEAVDVGGGVGLGVVELLGAGEGLLEGQALGAHLVEDVVGGAVDDANAQDNNREAK